MRTCVSVCMPSMLTRSALSNSHSFVCLFACLFACWLVCLFACLLVCVCVCRHALGVPPGAPPPYIGRMAMLGYPPGYTRPPGSSARPDQAVRVLLNHYVSYRTRGLTVCVCVCVCVYVTVCVCVRACVCV
jgi:hypothetical protein